ncbi:LOW QUALITY PROTEIN: heterogeneous nuclear ribonucleoprotein L [Lagopus muta]|uniref:LOW QUALITY PROTEIN: heterogeneous nuclear ribonucleoprotein L n=1 Tax=Lagopus muta TaxID=64668 RepID=UPI00209C7916|nr:LOW QUALITY PROTEIN: heterogeneous nuclear ribonucleoprotein L [Lagopus muta]
MERALRLSGVGPAQWGRGGGGAAERGAMSRRRWRGPQSAEGSGRGGEMGKMAAGGGGGGGSGRYYGGGGDGGRAPKRQKTENAEPPPHGPGGPGGGGGAGAGGAENYDDPHKTPASPVVHIRGLIDGVVEADLVEALQEFGPISYVVVMPKKRQALVEFEDILGACNAVNYAADNQIYIAGHPAFVNYSTSQKISRPGDSDDSRGVNNVLLFTILNPIYSSRRSLTSVSLQDVLYTICNPCGPVQRIVIFRKNGVQAMVEYPLVPQSSSILPCCRGVAGNGFKCSSVAALLVLLQGRFSVAVSWLCNRSYIERTALQRCSLCSLLP